jgi:hypothetical protein
VSSTCCRTVHRGHVNTPYLDGGNQKDSVFGKGAAVVCLVQAVYAESERRRARIGRAAKLGLSTHIVQGSLGKGHASVPRLVLTLQKLPPLVVFPGRRPASPGTRTELGVGKSVPARGGMPVFKRED